MASENLLLEITNLCFQCILCIAKRDGEIFDTCVYPVEYFVDGISSA